MLEDKNTVNNFQISRNEKQSGNKRLKAFFENSTFLAQQEELSLFMSNFPLIRFHEVNSINQLIDLVIRQNEILGKKCQQNILTTREMYGKHEELLRQIRSLQNRIEEQSKQIEMGGKMSQVNAQVEGQVEQFRKEIKQFEQRLKGKDLELAQSRDETQQSNHQNKYYHDSLQQMGDIIKMLTDRNYRRVSDKAKEMMGSKGSGKTSLSWVDWEELQRYSKEQKKRAKYYPKIRETVELFCNRFLKISEYVPPQLVKEQFNRQVHNLLQILDDLLLLRRRNSLLNSQSRASQINPIDGNFFEGLLDKVLREQQNHSVTKEEIASQLQEVKQQLYESKNHYEQYLMKIRMEFEEKNRRRQEEIVEKDQMLQFYEAEKEKMTKESMQSRNKLVQLEQTLKAQRSYQQTKSQDCATLQAKLQSAKNQFSIKQKQIRQQWEENSKTYEYKLTQKQQLLQEEQKQKKAIKCELQERINELKLQISAHQQKEKNLSQSLKEVITERDAQAANLKNALAKAQTECQSLEKELAEKNMYFEELTHRLERQYSQTKLLKAELSQDQRERTLQAEYIKQLQSKNTEILNKVKQLQSKKNEQKTVKKELNSMKQTIVQQKKHTREIEGSYQAQREENQRLKGIIKQMKKELEEVYLQFNHLKMIEGDREKLIVEIEKSDRMKEELCKEYDNMKLDLMKLQQENKSLLLEIKHYRNALSRIQALR